MHRAGRSSARQAAALGYGRSSSATSSRSRRSASAGSVASSRAAQYAAFTWSCRPDRFGSLAAPWKDWDEVRRVREDLRLYRTLFLHQHVNLITYEREKLTDRLNS